MLNTYPLTQRSRNAVLRHTFIEKWQVVSLGCIVRSLCHYSSPTSDYFPNQIQPTDRAGIYDTHVYLTFATDFLNKRMVLSAW